MANKKIWELPSWVPSGNTFNNTIPIDNNFVTQKISLSAITEYVQNNITVIFTGNTSGNCINELHVENLYGCSPIKVWDEVNFLSSISAVTYYGDGGNLINTIKYNEVTYSELYGMVTGSSLNVGGFYLITDFQTCYDQPDYDTDGNPIIIGNYKTGSTEPLLVFATSGNTLSPQAYSTIHPLDKITYDITWNITEVTSSPAKGRIIERIDEFNNRADYDFRNVLFKRYRGYFSEVYFSGKINLDGSTGQVTGTNTQFSLDFLVGDVVGIYYGSSPISCFKYYEITQINSDTDMFVSGKTLQNVSNTYYSRGSTFLNLVSPFQCNMIGGINDDVTEYLTFDAPNYNTYLGNNYNYDTFILSNNVFIGGDHNNNTFGGNVVGNTFDDDMDSNSIGAYFQYNIITNDFQRNIIGPYFQRNIIECDMEGNTINYNFQYNMLGDSDGWDFDYNTIGSNFFGNFLTFNNNDFRNNIIGNNFISNIIDSGFRNNKIQGDFNENLIINNSFNDNAIEVAFSSNKIPVSFIENKIGADFSQNFIYSQFNRNTILNTVNNNFFGDINNIGFYSFYSNKIGNYFNNNFFSGNCEYNIIGDDCYTNNIANNFSYNKIGNYFNNNTIGEGFGFGFATSQGNVIGNFFHDNIIGEYFYNNVIADGFYSNLVSDFFQLNTVQCSIPLTNFGASTLVYGDYNCTLFKRSDGNIRLSYYDSSDILNITNITD